MKTLDNIPLTEWMWVKVNDLYRVHISSKTQQFFFGLETRTFLGRFTAFPRQRVCIMKTFAAPWTRSLTSFPIWPTWPSGNTPQWTRPCFGEAFKITFNAFMAFAKTITITERSTSFYQGKCHRIEYIKVESMHWLPINHEDRLFLSTLVSSSKWTSSSF